MEQTLPKLNLLDLGHQEIVDLVSEFGWPRYRAQQILSWLYQHRIQHIDEMTNLSKANRDRLKDRSVIYRPACGEPNQAQDGTKKFVSALDDGLAIETVLIPEGRRRTLCLSSQVGCTLDCGFCLTAQLEGKRNLKAYEIVAQVLDVQGSLPENERLSSLVFMGMGEPLVNFDQVAEAISRLTNLEWGVGFSPRRITVSTAGWIPRFPEVRRLGVNLAISLNATTNEQRTELMPAINRRFDLPALMNACQDYSRQSERPLTFEYVLLHGVNDSPEDARRLVKLLRGLRAKVNLIPFNPFPGAPFQRPSVEAIESFQGVVRSKGLDVFLRKSRGDDVLGACGQLGRGGASSPKSPVGNLEGELPVYAKT